MQGTAAAGDALQYDLYYNRIKFTIVIKIYLTLKDRKITGSVEIIISENVLLLFVEKFF